MAQKDKSVCLCVWWWWWWLGMGSREAWKQTALIKAFHRLNHFDSNHDNGDIWVIQSPHHVLLFLLSLWHTQADTLTLPLLYTYTSLHTVNFPAFTLCISLLRVSDMCVTLLRENSNSAFLWEIVCCRHAHWGTEVEMKDDWRWRWWRGAKVERLKTSKKIGKKEDVVTESKDEKRGKDSRLQWYSN